MASSIRIAQFEGLTPAIDARQSNKPLLIEGRNVLVTAEGPKSAFGADLTTKDRLHDGAFTKTFEVEGDIIIASKGAILQHNDTLGVYQSITTFADDGTLWPWTHVKVGTKHYFARRGVGELIFDPSDGTWLLGDASIVCVTRSGGRLVYLTDLVVGWSDIDEGENKTPSTTTGAGTQSLAIIGEGNGLFVIESPQGFITYTDDGGQVSQLIDSINPFRHIPMIDPQIPVSAFCIVPTTNKRHILLSEVGLFRLDGSQLNEYQPLFNEYLRNSLFPTMAFRTLGTLKLTYDEERRYLYLSVSETDQVALFDFAWVLNTNLDKWGRFTHAHQALNKFKITPGGITGFNFGYVCSEGFVHTFNDLDRDEVPGTNETSIFFRVPGDIAPWIEDASGTIIHHFAASMQMYTEDIVPVAGVVSARYETLDSMQSILVFDHTNSLIIVGPFRLSDDINDDVTQLSNVLTVAVGIPTQIGDETSEDWLVDGPAVEDWLDNTTNSRGDQDWGDGLFGFGSDFQILIKGTLDANIVFESNNEILTPISSEEVADGFINYDANSNGIYHIVEFSTVSFGQSFHLRLLELSGILAGILGD